MTLFTLYHFVNTSDTDIMRGIFRPSRWYLTDFRIALRGTWWILATTSGVHLSVHFLLGDEWAFTRTHTCARVCTCSPPPHPPQQIKSHYWTVGSFIIACQMSQWSKINMKVIPLYLSHRAIWYGLYFTMAAQFILMSAHSGMLLIIVLACTACFTICIKNKYAQII